MPNRRKGEGKRIGNGNPSKATASTSAMISSCNLPEDLIFEILSRLPVKSLLRFQSVSIPWLALIKNPKFISLHLNRTAMNPKNDSVIIRQYHIMSLFNVNSTDKPINLDHPFPEIFPRMELVGCYNGLVCLSYPPLGKLIILWNPATRQYKVIQLSYLNSEDVDMVSVGFGFDPVANDYKIIRIMRLIPKPPRDLLRVEFEVYSAKNDSWKMFQVETPFFIPLTRCTAILKGAPYWKTVIRDEEEDSGVLIVLLYFDPKNESFSLWQSPECPEGTISEAVELRDELVSLVYSSREESNKYVYVWMEDDCKESRIKKIGPIPIKVVNIIHCCKNGEILAEGTEGKLFLYDPETNGIKNIPIDEVQANSYEAFSYTESLVSFEGMKQVGQKE